MSIQCEEIKNYLLEFVDKELSFKDNELVKEHLKNCKNCNDYRNALEIGRLLLDEDSNEEMEFESEPIPPEIDQKIRSKLNLTPKQKI